jgi:hypothetical protein
VNWVHAFLNTLNENEVKKLQSIKLIGKEKMLADFFMHHRGIPIDDAENICYKLEISTTHFYKISSVLLGKFYHALIPHGGFELFYFLIDKGLYAHFKSAITHHEKQILKSGDKKEISDFYLKGFHLLLDMPYKYFDKKLRDHFANAYLNNKPQLTESDKLYIKHHCIYNDINVSAARKNPHKAFGISIEQLFASEKKLKGSKHYLAQYYLFRTICSYYSYYEKNAEKVIEYLQKAIALKDNIKDFFPVNINHFLYLLYADALFTNGKIDEALTIYHKILKSDIEKNMYGYYYHYEQYAMLNIIKKDFGYAKEILNRIFAECIKSKKDIYATRGAMTYAKLYLSSGDYKSAMTYIRIGHNINEKSFYLPFDVQLRVLENIGFILKEDFSFAKKLANKNIKFLSSQKEPSSLSEYFDLWKTLIDLCNVGTKKAALTEQLEKNIDKLNTRFRYLYANLLECALQAAKHKIKA